MKKILITGITGQDGLFLTSKILKREKKVEIIGISRNKYLDNFYEKLKSIHTNNLENIRIKNLDLEDTVSVQHFLENENPSEIYNLTGPSSVNKSLEKNNKSYETILKIFENIVSGFIKTKKFPNIFQASSSEMYSSNLENSLTEESLMSPNSPYAKAKYEIHNKIKYLNEKYDWNIISGIMFNHESEFRNQDYLMPKIIDYSKNIDDTTKTKLKIGSLDYVRDWSYAEDIMDAAHTLMINEANGPYVIGSGEGNNIQKMVDIIFRYQDLDWKEFVEVDSTLLRKGDPLKRVSDPKKIYSLYNWKTKLGFEDLVIKCLEHRFLN